MKYLIGGPLKEDGDICHFCGEDALDAGFECTECGADNFHLYQLPKEKKMNDEMNRMGREKIKAKAYSLLRWIDSSTPFWVALSMLLLILMGVARD